MSLHTTTPAGHTPVFPVIGEMQIRFQQPEAFRTYNGIIRAHGGDPGQGQIGSDGARWVWLPATEQAIKLAAEMILRFCTASRPAVIHWYDRDGVALIHAWKGHPPSSIPAAVRRYSPPVKGDVEKAIRIQLDFAAETILRFTRNKQMSEAAADE